MARRIVKLAARGVERIHVGLLAFAFRLLVLHFRHRTPEAERKPIEGNLVLPANALAAAIALERKVLAACPAQVNFAPGMRAAGAFDRERTVFFAIHMVERGFTVGARGSHCSVFMLNPLRESRTICVRSRRGLSFL